MPATLAMRRASGFPVTGTILHFNPWMGFNDGPPSEDPFGCAPHPEPVAVFLDTVFSWVRGAGPVAQAQ